MVLSVRVNGSGTAAMIDLPQSVSKFKAAAEARGLDPAVVVHESSARTAEEAAAACGCDLGQIVKSLVFRGAETGLPILLLVSGRNRVDEGRAAEAAGEMLLRADAAFVREATGYAIGGIPPLGHDRPARTFMDPALLGFDEVWAAAGHPNAVFPIAPDRLKSLTGAVTADLAAA